ncbi:MAG: FtsW/RodA/SpoVE family cell cycle protein [Bacteroidales bacterium]|jgi:cell division protein FtsW|nr:FtsW/RodA/SpoVE family cell cycle protein [Bacteroidales bacterium]
MSIFRNIKFKLKGDKIIWIAFLFLIFISALEVYSTSGKTVYEEQGGSPISFFAKHIFILALGTVVMFFVHNIKYTTFSKINKVWIIVVCILLILPLFTGSLGDKAAARWIKIPFIGGQFQPSEIAKIILILYVSKILTLSQQNIKSWDVFKKLIGVISIVCILIFPQNFSTAAILFLICFLMMFVARINLKYLGGLSLIIIVGLITLFTIIQTKPDSLDFILEREGAWNKRIEEYIDNDKIANTQTNVALMAIGSGGFKGKGLGNTKQARFLYASHNDFIYSIIIEEGGLILGVIVILLYLILLYRGVQIAKKAEGFFGSFCAIGFTLMIVVQALVNMFVATKITPVTGQTLPFISYGGTSFLFSCIALGIVLSISADANKENIKNNLQNDIDEKSINEKEIKS